MTADVAVTRLEPTPPPVLANPPRPYGDLCTAEAAEILAVAEPIWATSKTVRTALRSGIPELLAELDKAPGATWQQRWEARGLNDGTLVPADLVTGKTDRGRMTSAARILFCLRVVRPSMEALRAARYPEFAEHLRRAANDPLLDKFFEHVRGSEARDYMQRIALGDVAQCLAVFDIGLADLTPGVLMHFALTSRELTGYRHMPVAGATWQLLRSMGVFPPSSPHSLQAALRQGQLTIEQLVDRDRPATPGVREVFIEYLRRRAVGLDYNTLSQLAHLLTQLFWRNVEKVNPQQVGLQLSEETYQQWKQSVSVLPSGGPRLNMINVLLRIRSFYLDLQSWAYDDPGLWGPWVAPCPVREVEVRRTHVARRRINERMADRTRIRQPLLPLLVDHVTNRWLYYRDLLAATQAAGIGEHFTYDGVQWQRTASENDRRYVERGEDYRLRAVNRETGELVNVALEEQGAFFDWAMVEILRHAGLRIEELLELTHLSIRNYQRTNGEVIALLVIAPSKADRERVISMSAELFHAIAQVIKRHRIQHGTVPLAHSYDPYERVWKTSLPYLFQRLNGRQRHLRRSAADCSCVAPSSRRPTRNSRASPSRRTTSAGCSRPNWSTPAFPSTSARLCSGTSASRPLAATSRSSTTWLCSTTSSFSTGAANNARPRNTANPPRPSGPSSRSTSTNARSNWAPAAAPTALRAPTSTPASDAPCSPSTRKCSRAWTSSRPT
jgi:hypothetical protein